MLVAVLTRPPKWGSSVKSFDAAAGKAVKGVVDVFAIPHGVVVLAEKTWPALKAGDLLTIEWDHSTADARSSSELFETHRSHLEETGLVGHTQGDAEAGLELAETVIEAAYESHTSRMHRWSRSP